MAISTLLKGLGIGAGLMYFADPNSGRRRRARVLDQWDHAVHRTQDFLDKAQRDATNRAVGLTAQATSLLHRDTADDDVVTARVRSKLGRYASQPRAIAVETYQGRVTLSGSVPEHEVGELLNAICSVSGVRGVDNRLDVRQQPYGLSAADRGDQHERDLSFWESSWNPSTRAIGQLAGAMLMSRCLVKQSLTSKLLGTAGLGLFIRATTNQTFGQLLGTAEHPQPMRLQRTVTIQAPVEKVWDFLSDFEEVARFLPGVTRVQELGDGMYRWAMELPGGQELELEERLTAVVPQERLQWESVSQQPLWYQGSVVLQNVDADATRVHLCLDYVLPGGALGAAVASLFGADPQGLFQQAMLRIKPFLETGNLPHDVRDLRRGESHGESHGESPSLSAMQPELEPNTSWSPQPKWVQGQPEAADAFEHPHLVHGQPELVNALEHPQRVSGIPAESSEMSSALNSEQLASDQVTPRSPEHPHSALSADQIPPAVHAEADPNHHDRSPRG